MAGGAGPAVAEGAQAYGDAQDQEPGVGAQGEAAHLLAYDLIRGVMAEAARVGGIEPRRVGFKGAQHTVREFGAVHLHDPERIERDLPHLVSLIGQKRVGDRPDRYEPEAVGRRPEPHPLLRMTRGKARALIKRGIIPYEKMK